MRRFHVIVAIAGFVGLTIGGRDATSAPKAAAVRDRCFELVYDANSRGTNALFNRRHLQSGGPTWAAIIETAVKAYTTFIREGTTYSPDMPGFGVPMIVTYRGVQTWYVLDDEGDGAIFCAGDKALLAAARADYKRFNTNAKALEDAITRVPKDRLE